MNKVALGSICNLSIGFVGTVTTQYENGGVPFLRTLNIKPYKIDPTDLKRISLDFHRSQKKSILKKDDIIMVHTGTPGYCCVIPDEYDESNCIDAIVIKPDSTKVNPYFLEAYMNSIGYRYIQKQQVGCVQKHFNLSDAINFQLFLPEIGIQNRIGNFIHNINLKIFNNDDAISQLEAMAKTLYDYWFVQFDFPDENGKPYRTSGGEMVWNEQLKREIPKGWEVGRLCDIANITMGQSPTGESYNDIGDGLIFYQGRTDFGLRFPTPRMYTTAPTRFAQKGDILLSVRAPVGDLNFAMEDCCIGRGLAALNSKLGSQMHLFYTLTGFQQIFKVMDGNGTTFGSITKDILFGMAVVIPSDEILKCFDKMVKPIELKIEKCEEEIRELTKLRDWLLPMLMNGQARVE
jgi:type I restriction enzyme S subunit